VIKMVFAGLGQCDRRVAGGRSSTSKKMVQQLQEQWSGNEEDLRRGVPEEHKIESREVWMIRGRVVAHRMVQQWSKGV